METPAAPTAVIRPAIRVEACSFAYEGEALALTDIDFTLEKGQLLCLAGANGSGKSTLLCLLAGLFRPSRGSIFLGPLRSPGEENRFREWAGLVMQDADVQILGATVGEDMLLGLDAEEPGAREAALALAERFGLAGVWDSPVHHLSHGMKRKLCLAATLLSSPRALLFDEPMSGLDYPAMLEMRAILGANKRLGLTQIVSAHDLEPIIDLADVLAVLSQGRLALFGPPAELLDRTLALGVRPPCSWRAGLGISPWA